MTFLFTLFLWWHQCSTSEFENFLAQPVVVNTSSRSCYTLFSQEIQTPHMESSNPPPTDSTTFVGRIFTFHKIQFHQVSLFCHKVFCHHMLKQVWSKILLFVWVVAWKLQEWYTLWCSNGTNTNVYFLWWKPQCLEIIGTSCSNYLISCMEWCHLEEREYNKVRKSD